MKGCWLPFLTHVVVSRRPFKRVAHAEHEHRQQHHWENRWEHYANHGRDNPVPPSTFHLKALHMAVDDWLCDYCKLTEYALSTASLHFSLAAGRCFDDEYRVLGESRLIQDAGV